MDVASSMRLGWMGDTNGMVNRGELNWKVFRSVLTNKLRKLKKILIGIWFSPRRDQSC